MFTYASILTGSLSTHFRGVPPSYLVIQVAIYFSHVFGLHPHFLAHGSQNPWDFLNVESDKGIFCSVNEVTFGKHLRVGAGCQWSQPCDQRVGTFSPTSCPPSGEEGGERGWRLNQLPMASDLKSIKTQESLSQTVSVC